MPTVLRAGPYRIYFWSHEPDEPPHVHVDRDANSAKFWLGPIRFARTLSFSSVELRRIERRGMITSDVKPGEGVEDVHVTEDTLSVDLIDGRTIIVPLVWYPKLLHATPGQRANWQICGGGYGIHWPDIDEDLSNVTDALTKSYSNKVK